MFVIVKDTTAQAVKRIQVQAARPTMGLADPVTLVPVALDTLAPADPHTMDREDPATWVLVVTVRNVQKFVRINSANWTEHSSARRKAHSTLQNNLR